MIELWMMWKAENIVCIKEDECIQCFGGKTIKKEITMKTYFKYVGE
jgi:hypothetical protein